MSNEQEQVQHYKQLVLDYEAIDAKVDALLENNGGHTENMTTSDMQTYRQLAAQRDDLFNQIRAIEAGWLADEE